MYYVCHIDNETGNLSWINYIKIHVHPLISGSFCYM